MRRVRIGGIDETLAGRSRADRDAITAERLAFFGEHRPPHTGIIIAGLGSPEVLVEVEVIAYLPQRFQ